MNAVSRQFLQPITHQFQSRLRSFPQIRRTVVPPAALVALLALTLGENFSAAPFYFAIALAALYCGGSAAIREIVDEREWLRLQKDLSLLGYIAGKLLYGATVAAMQSVVFALILLIKTEFSFPLLSFCLILFLTTFAGVLLALLVSALSSNASSALSYFPLVLVPQILFSGFLLPVKRVEPFAFSKSGAIVRMPEEFVRPASSPVVVGFSNFSIARWSVEALTAASLEQPFGVESGRVMLTGINLIPLTLETQRDPVAEFRSYLENGSVGSPPEFSGLWLQYLLLLSGACIALCVVLTGVMIVRDPRPL